MQVLLRLQKIPSHAKTSEPQLHHGKAAASVQLEDTSCVTQKKKNFFCFFSEKNCNVPAVTCTDMVASEWDFQLFSYYLSFWASVEGTKFVFGAGLMTWWETTTVFLFHVRTGSPVFIREPEMVQGQGQSHVAEATKCFQHSTQQTAAHQRVTWWKYDCVSEHGNERLGLLSVLREQ